MARQNSEKEERGKNGGKMPSFSTSLDQRGNPPLLEFPERSRYLQPHFARFSKKKFLQKLKFFFFFFLYFLVWTNFTLAHTHFALHYGNEGEGGEGKRELIYVKFAFQ